jgi:hypothetical protein
MDAVMARTLHPKMSWAVLLVIVGLFTQWPARSDAALLPLNEE